MDLEPESDLDEVAQIALDISEKIREQDVNSLFDELCALCQYHPAKAAQLLMTFAAWFDPETPTQALWQRVAAIAEDRTRPVVAV